MTLFDSPSFANHEGVHAVFDEKTGLRAIIAVHSSARGPAVGGTRMWNYASSAEALEDVLRKHGKIKKAWLVRKEVPGGGPPHFVMVVDWRGMVFSSTSELERLLAALELPGSVYVLEKPGSGANGRSRTRLSRRSTSLSCWAMGALRPTRTRTSSASS